MATVTPGTLRRRVSGLDGDSDPLGAKRVTAGHDGNGDPKALRGPQGVGKRIRP